MLITVLQTSNRQVKILVCPFSYTPLVDYEGYSFLSLNTCNILLYEVSILLINEKNCKNLRAYCMLFIMSLRYYSAFQIISFFKKSLRRECLKATVQGSGPSL